MKIFKIILILGLIIFFPLNIDAQEVSLDPVVLVPGIMGAWNWKVLLSGSNPDTWNFFSTDHTWDNMIDALENDGYVRDENLFIAFYDWRQNNINSVTDYLIPTIDKALLNSTTGKVDIIAHSMGGLVSRAYIQSDDYRDDIDQLIMLGTPNYGSSDVYTLWEGGKIPKNWNKTDQHGISFMLWMMTNFSDNTSDYYDTIHTFVPSIRELLPVYDFLADSDLEGGLKTYDSLSDAKNPFLENLNFSGTGVELQGLGGITVIAGKGENTVGNIPVVNRPDTETKLWADGIPEPITPVRNDANGDNRVLLDSAFINDIVFPAQPTLNFWQRIFAIFYPKVQAAYDGGNPDDFLKHIEIDSTHGGLPTTAIPEVSTALGLPPPTILYIEPTEPDNITTFWFASPVDVQVTDPQNRVITKDSNNIPEAIYTGESDPNGMKMIIIPNGLSGDYKVELVGRADGEYHMAVASFADNADNIVTVEKDVSEGEKVEYTISINQESSLVEIGDPIITEPESDSALDLLNNLIASVEDYYATGQINNKGLYQSLLNDLRLTLVALKLYEFKVPLAKKLALAKLNSFIRQVNTQSKKRKIDSVAALDMVTQAEAVIAKVNN